MMKTIIIPVRKEFTCPSLFTQDDNTEAKEIALLIGAYAVSYISVDKQQQEAQKLIQKASSDRCKSLIQQLETLQSQFDVKIKEEKDKLRHELLDSVKLEVQNKEREKFLSEKELLIEKLDKKYQRELDIKNEEKKEIRKEFEALRLEHDGLVMKLMSRLESSSSVRSGFSSTTLGRTFEENVEKHLRQVFGARKGFELIDVHSQGHSGDFILIFDNLRILIELKSYDPKTKVPTKEVEKLARDLSEIQPKCNAAIMISACSEITGHYTCGPLEVSSEVACVPVLFINNFLSLGDPLVTLHMIKVFLMMVSKSSCQITLQDDEIESDDDDLKRINIECARRCTGYLTELNKQSSELMKQISVMKNSITKLKESIIAFIETEISRFNGIILLTTRMDQHNKKSDEIELDKSVFSMSMTEDNKKIAISISENFFIGDQTSSPSCPTKDMIQFIQKDKEISEKTAREIMKNIFLETVIKHGYLSGVSKKSF